MFWRGWAIGELDDGATNHTLASVTHARLRAQQGDKSGARAVLRSILRGRPGDAAAAQLLASIQGLLDSRHQEPVEPRLRAVQAADAVALADRFRATLAGKPAPTAAARIRAWLRRIERNRGARRDAR